MVSCLSLTNWWSFDDEDEDAGWSFFFNFYTVFHNNYSFKCCEIQNISPSLLLLVKFVSAELLFLDEMRINDCFPVKKFSEWSPPPSNRVRETRMSRWATIMRPWEEVRFENCRAWRRKNCCRPKWSHWSCSLIVPTGPRRTIDKHCWIIKINR